MGALAALLAPAMLVWCSGQTGGGLAPPPPPPPPVETPDPVLGWPHSPLKDLPALPKPHLTWSLGGVPYNSSSPTQLDFARITHSLPIRVPLHSDSKTFKITDTNAADVLEAVKLCSAANASLNLNWSPWYYYYNCTNYTGLDCKNDPRVQGEPEAAEIALFTEYLTRAQSWVTAANQQTGADVRISSVALDSEKFAFANAHHAVVGTQEWIGNLTRKNNLVYETVKKVLGESVLPFQYDRGGCGRCQPQWASDPPGSNSDPWNRGIGWCADGFRYVDTYTLQPDELGDMYGLSLYTVAEPGNTRAQMNNTANRCLKDPRCKSVMPTIVLGAGYRHNLSDFGATFFSTEVKGSAAGHDGESDFLKDGRRSGPDWDYEPYYSWILGAQLNRPEYGGSNSSRWARWDMASQVQLFPGPFGNALGDYKEQARREGGKVAGWGMECVPNCANSCDKLPRVPCGPSKTMMRHFIYYVAGAHHITNFTLPTFLLDKQPDPPGWKSDDDATPMPSCVEVAYFA
jgi:hypothetical protein